MSICRNCKYFTNGDSDRTEYCAGFEAKENRYPEHIMQTLRKRLGLVSRDDTSRDNEINKYTPNEAFEEMCNWEGILGYANTIKGWIKDIYGIDLDKVEIMLKLSKDITTDLICGMFEAEPYEAAAYCKENLSETEIKTLVPEMYLEYFEEDKEDHIPPCLIGLCERFERFIDDNYEEEQHSYEDRNYQRLSDD